jgi:antitoxin component YwqK of YwqJK toxin-antitoxin module
MKVCKLRSWFVFLLVLNFTFLQSQEISSSASIELLDSGLVKMYFNENLELISKECSNYYGVFEVDDEFRPLGEFKVSYKDGSTFLRGNLKQHKMEGDFVSFYPNGNKYIEFTYKNRQRAGMWSFYHRNGQLKKEVLYAKEGQKLWSLYDENGRSLVTEANGFFRDSVTFNLDRKETFWVEGGVKKGLPDGSWNFYAKEGKVLNEYFKDFKFIQGKSFLFKKSDHFYTTHYFSNVVGKLFWEEMSFGLSNYCEKQSQINWYWWIYKKIKKDFTKKPFGADIPDNWFLITVTAERNKKISKVEVLSPAEDEVKAYFENLVRGFKSVKTFGKIYNAGKLELFVWVKDGKIITFMEERMPFFNFL